jgi:hypothetical protein
MVDYIGNALPRQEQQRPGKLDIDMLLKTK